MNNKKFEILKSFGKGIVKILTILLVLAVIYYGVDLAFQNVLSSTSRAVFSNFILFALIIVLVMKNVVHPKAMLEQAQGVVETEINNSESAREDSENRLEAAQKTSRGVKKEVKEILKKSEENAQLVGAKIIQDAEQTALVLKENAEKAIENNQILLKNDLIKRASLASIEVAKTHIINELNNNDELHMRLIEESIEALVENKEIEEVG
ncbi:MAG: ATP synthase F0 subunit B [Cyanobacteria bacterium SIG31]|nr:ATP synthase F0 subunit B [Cyanobacteria bacterium SIG31]